MDTLEFLGIMGKALFDTGKDLVNAGKEDYKKYKDKQEQRASILAAEEEKRARNQARREEREAYKNSLKKPILLPDNEYSYQDLINCDINFAEYLTAWTKGVGKNNPFLEPDFNHFKEIVSRTIDGLENENHETELMNIYKIFLYNFCDNFPIQWSKEVNAAANIRQIEDYLAYALSVASAKKELTLKGIDLFENNAAEKRSRELFREYFHEQFERVTDETYKTAIHGILTGQAGENDKLLSAAVNLIENYNFLLEHPEELIKRGNKSHIKLLKEAEERRLELEAKKKLDAEKEEQERQEKIAREEELRKKRLEVAKRLKQLEEAEKQRRLEEAEAERQKKEERLLHADDDL